MELGDEKEKAIKFAKENLINPDGILNYGELDIDTINIINETFFEMINIFGVKLDAIGIEANLEGYGRRLNVSDIRREKEKQEVLDSFNKSGSWVRSWSDNKLFGAFFKEELWKNDTKRLKEEMEKAFETGWLKHKDIKTVIIHEYAHCLYFLKKVGEGEVGSFYVEVSNLLGGCSLSLIDSKRFCLISELLGKYICFENPPQEFWAEIVACYYYDKNNDKEKILSNEIYTKTERLLDKVRVRCNMLR